MYKNDLLHSTICPSGEVMTDHSEQYLSPFLCVPEQQIFDINI